METHPFGIFVPENARYLMLGSFPGKQAFKRAPSYDKYYDWYYCSRRSQFWSIMEAVYGLRLRTVDAKQGLCDTLGLAMGDVILRCVRREANNSDENLTNITYNTKAVAEVLAQNDIHTIFFTSRYVAERFRTQFKSISREYPDIERITLPSPSPRYAKLSKPEKIKEYRQLLPRIS